MHAVVKLFRQCMDIEPKVGSINVLLLNRKSRDTCPIQYSKHCSYKRPLSD